MATSVAPNQRVSISTLLGEKLLTESKGGLKHTKTLMKNVDVVALYFSASWCPPCKVFSPILREFYNAAAKDNGLEIVYISSDKDVASFEEYYKKMPWLAIPTQQGSAEIKNNLAQILGIQGIPTLVVLDAKTGEFITGDARGHVEDAGGDAAKAKAAIDMWKAMDRKPLSEATKHMPGMGGNPLMKIVMFFAKNPVYIFALMYFYKYLTKQMKIWYPDAYPAEAVEDEVPVTDPHEEEF
ncbi:thioredoxin-like protein [Nitzschia inconspicua]|uniref:Thioredoxin-like protein n=1 Tax=Nitzschia inconspicua TaxID=303405 RepID=A0A9K3M3S7_9STRA|nr:thioredoxin-like protein [Nitzschia inconspicua]